MIAKAARVRILGISQEMNGGDGLAGSPGRAITLKKASKLEEPCPCVDNRFGSSSRPIL